jgi:hypothetical protein
MQGSDSEKSFHLSERDDKEHQIQEPLITNRSNSVKK